MEKRPTWRGFLPLALAFCYGYRLRYLSVRPNVPSARRRQVTERSERTVEEAEKNRMLLGALTQ